ncbi:MAG: IS1380 family transposase [Candidatus Binatia bacterium]
MATECHSRSGFGFQRRLVVDFDGGEITGDAGLVVLREFDERLGLTGGLGKLVGDTRDRRYVSHSVVNLVRQRIYQIAAGYEDTNDATFLRDDPAMRAVIQSVDRPLASQPTLSRLENDTEWDSIRLLEREGLEWFCRVGGAIDGRRQESSAELILDADSSQDPTYGQQELTFFNRHYDSYMYHPMFVFEGGSGMLLASRLRPGDVGGIRQLLPLLRPTVRRLQARFPKRPIAIRADGDFAKAELLDYAEYAGCSYTIGMPRNSKLEGLVEPLRQKAEARWKETGKPVRLYTSLSYQTRSWSRARRIVAKVEYTALGKNLRFVVTNRAGRAEAIFDWYEQRGQAENFIKDLKNEVAADRLSCSAYRANAFRLQLHALAYNLLVLFRRLALRGTALASATMGTIRLRLLKVGARVRRSVRRLCFHLASGWPGQPLFLDVLDRVAALRASG